ncbi:hypothetical protein KP509_24G004300 [Ceratopteris richardii]|uniref:Uncharacterized protein n=1 Tax=Ceratopteris richardii TaxID=49495 RepID=A0A8T2RTS5_CERRI|nr:hypothetical protein KP509_24G004300 [Ceratopteris richardii]
MGCFPALHLLRCTSRSSTVKIVTVEGRCLRYPAPVLVKEVLVDYPTHDIYFSETVRFFADRARPLHRTCSLLPGHLYFLVPRVAVPSFQSPAESSKKVLSSTRARRVSFANSSDCTQSRSEAHENQREIGDLADNWHDETGISENQQKNSVELVHSPSEGVMRLKMVVSRKQLEALLRDRSECLQIVQGILSPFLREFENPARSKVAPVSWNEEWKPSLRSIPESPPSRRS